MMDTNTDLSKIIGIIMENPDILERIKSLAKKDDSPPENESTERQIEIKSENVAYTENDSADFKMQKEENENINTITADSEPTYFKKGFNKKKRNELLCALKPYISKERCKAIDTMLSVFDIFEIMKER